MIQHKTPESTRLILTIDYSQETFYNQRQYMVIDRGVAEPQLLTFFF